MYNLIEWGGKFMIKYWYLKYREKFVATLSYDEDKDMFSLDVERPDLFVGGAEKCFYNDTMCREWFESRLTPQYQGGYVDKMTKLGLDINDPKHRQDLFILSRGFNIKDDMWLADSKDEPFENSPMYGL